MTPLTKPVTRLTRVIDYRSRKPIVASLTPGGVRLKAWGERRSYLVPFEAIWVLGGRIKAAEEKAVKDQKRKEAKEAAKAARRKSKAK